MCSPGHAQISARLDVTTTSRYVWHGLERVSCCLVVEPAFATGFQAGSFILDAGIVRYYEPFRAPTWAASEVGAQSRGLGEENLWMRTGVALGPLQLSGGVIRYLFYGQTINGGLSSARNTSEIYTGVRLQGAYVRPTVESWWDVDRVKGGFLRVSASLPALAWPFPPYAFTYIDGELGINLGQGPDAGQLANFASRGVTHAGLGATADVRTGAVPGGQGVLSLGFRTQLNFDDATRATGANHQSDVVAWFWAGLTVLIGGDAKVLQ